MRTLSRTAFALGSAAFVISMASLTGANAATFTTSGGSTIDLPSSFDPSNIAAINADHVAVGSAVVTYGQGTSTTQGLFFGSGNETFTFTFMGKEASDTNSALVMGSTTLFDNNAAPGTSVTETVNDGTSGLVPFGFFNENSLASATNGGTISAGTHIAFDILSSTVVYAFFDDGGGGPDADYDDMVVRITATPRPAALPLFAGGLGFVGFLTRRKKRNGQALAAA